MTRAIPILNFASKYEVTLRGGFDSEPQNILAFIGSRLGDPNLVQPAARLLKEKTYELQRLYSRTRTDRPALSSPSYGRVGAPFQVSIDALWEL